MNIIYKNRIKKILCCVVPVVFTWLSFTFALKKIFPDSYPFIKVFSNYDNKIRPILKESEINVEILVVNKSKVSKSLGTNLSKGVFVYKAFGNDMIVEWHECDDGSIVLDSISKNN